MNNRLPPLDWIRVFEVAARHGNFVLAAKELFVTPGAVSRTIKELEGALGTTLFVRKPSGVTLTGAAEAFARSIGPAIRQIEQASTDFRSSKRHQTLRVTAMPGLAQRWLVPQLGEFNSLHPDITVTVSADSDIVDMSKRQYEVALRYDAASHPDSLTMELFRDELFPVVSPRLAQRVPLRVPQDLFALTALYDTYWEADWGLWLETHGLQVPNRWRSLYFTLYTMAVDAAVAGQGVLIGHAALIRDELNSGELIVPFAPRITSTKRYYALVHGDRADSPATRAFLDWLYLRSDAVVI